MELVLSFKSNKFVVTDKKERLIYTIKKKGFSGIKYVLLDTSNYQLYSFSQIATESKPTFVISHNDNSILHINCKSLFLDPTLTIDGRDIQGTPIKYLLASKDRCNFDLIKDDQKVGSIKISMTVNQKLQYDIEIDNKIFDDYVPLFALALELTFGERNRETIN